MKVLYTRTQHWFLLYVIRCLRKRKNRLTRIYDIAIQNEWTQIEAIEMHRLCKKEKIMPTTIKKLPQLVYREIIEVDTCILSMQNTLTYLNKTA